MLAHTCNRLPIGIPRSHSLPAVKATQPALLSIQLRRVACSAAAGNDPYTFLGVAPDADTNEINRAIAKKRFENKANDAMLKKIEQAQGQLFLSSLNRRMKGEASTPRDIKYADVEPLFPWRPKRWDATPKVIMIAGAIQLALAASAFQAPNMSKLIGCMLLGIAGNVMKQNAISPPPKEPEYATEEEAGRAGKNFMRGALLGLLATFAGMVLFTAPESICQLLKIPLPGILSTQPGILISFKVAGVALSNWMMTSFYY